MLVITILTIIVVIIIASNAPSPTPTNPIDISPAADISVLNSIGTNTVEGTQVGTTIPYNNTISTGANSLLHLEWEQHQIVVLANTTVQITPNGFTASSGYVYIPRTTSITIAGTFTTNNLNSVYEANTERLYVFGGTYQDDNITAVQNRFISLRSDPPSIGNIDRKVLAGQPWIDIANQLTEINLVPSTLTDLEEPEIVSLEPPEDSNPPTQLVTITGVANEQLEQVLVNTIGATVEGNEFTATIRLNLGSNPIVITLIDVAGNQNTITTTYTYNP